MKTYTLDQLKKQLIDDDFTIVPSLGLDPTGIDWYAKKSLFHDLTQSIPCCVHNNKIPSLVVTPWNFNGMHYSVSIELRGQLPGEEGLWVQLHSYSLPIDRVIELLPKITCVLRSSWKAAWEAAKDFDDLQMLDKLVAWA